MSTRSFSRVKFNIEATLRIAERQFRGAVENLSMTGMFLVTNEQLAIGEAVDIIIALSGTTPEIALHFNGIVTRTDEDGVGLTFDKLDYEVYMHLKNIIAYNSEDAEKIQDEISHAIDEKCALDKQ